MKEYLEKVLKRQGYEAPHAEIIAVETHGILCVSGGDASTGAGGETTNMGINTGFGW